jgi:hypothetical protein
MGPTYRDQDDEEHLDEPNDERDEECLRADLDCTESSARWRLRSISTLRTAAETLRSRGAFREACEKYEELVAELDRSIEELLEVIRRHDDLLQLREKIFQRKRAQAVDSEKYFQEVVIPSNRLEASRIAGRRGGQVGGRKKFILRYEPLKLEVLRIEAIVRQQWEQRAPEISARVGRQRLARAVLKVGRADLTQAAEVARVKVPTARTIEKWIDGRWLEDLL